MDARVSGAIITASECCALLAALVIVLSMIGVNVSGKLSSLPSRMTYSTQDAAFLVSEGPTMGLAHGCESTGSGEGLVNTH